ncbi:MAG: glycosyltransferase family 39 protein [Candidatus Baltobacteraceae bacterium]
MIALPVAIATLILHLATASRYGYFRDELYFIACSKHLAWGYVDQPPLVAIAAYFSAPFDYHLVALRFLPVLSASVATIAAAQIARELGGGRFAQFFTAVAVALTPAYLLLGNVLTTTSFEALSWTLAAWCTIRIVRGGGGTWWIALAAAVTFGLYGKYSMALLVAALLGALLMTQQRRVLATWWLALGAATALLLIAPNFAWQAAHGWPFFEVLRGDAAHRHAFNSGVALEYRNFFANARAFANEQLIYTNPVAVPVWLMGLAAPFAWTRLRDMRFISLAYAVLFAVAVVLEAKGYYIIGIYATLLAVGAVALERAAMWLRTGALVALATVAVVVLPLSIPVLSLQRFIGYTTFFGMTGGSGAPAHLMQPVYAEEFGWERLARDVARSYNAIDFRTRSRTAIYADTYADAGAIDFFGAKYGLPAAISSQNSYWLWGTRGYDGRTILAIGASRIDLLKHYYRHVELVSTSDEPLKWIVEGPAPVYLCSGPLLPFDEIWQRLRWYGA